MSGIIKSAVLSAVLLSGMQACTEREKSPKAYLAYFKGDNPLRKQVTTGGITYTLTLLPASYMAASYAMGPNEIFDAAKYQSRYADLEHVLFYSVAMYGEGANPMSYQARGAGELQQRISYYTTMAGSNFFLVIDDHDTLSPVDYIFENNMGVSNENKMLVAFPKPEHYQTLSLIYHDQPFQNYYLKSTITAAQMHQVPALKY